MTKALTLTQPWATLVATGTKGWETRSWATSHRGPLLIHAAKGWAREHMRLAIRLHERGILGIAARDLPLGAIVGRATLSACVSTSAWPPDLTLSDREAELGNYAPGRFAWLLERAIAFDEPIPWRGALGLWNGPDL